METWKLLLLVGGLLTLLFLALIGGIIITAESRIIKKNEEIRNLKKENAHKQQLLDAYGIKEITIGGDEDE